MNKIYGFQEGDLAQLGPLVSQVTGVEMTERDSDFRGGDYYTNSWEDKMDRGVEITLQLNRGYHEEYAKPDFPSVKVLLFLSGGEEANTLARRIESAFPRVLILNPRV
jgi:hypothetical protein